VELTQERLKEVLDYNATTGVFTRKISGSTAVKVGRVVGSGVTVKANYFKVFIDAQAYIAHRLVWLYVHGTWPKHFIDHVNGDRHDNRLCNLREASSRQNMVNSKLSKASTTGYKGATVLPSGRFRSKLHSGGQVYHLGVFDTVEEAHQAYCDKADELHGDFANHG